MPKVCGIRRTETVCLYLALVGCLLSTSPVKCAPPGKRDDCRPRKQNKPYPEEECAAALEPSISYYSKFKYSSNCTGITCDLRHDCGRAPMNTIRGNTFINYIIKGKPQRLGNWPSFATLELIVKRESGQTEVEARCGGVIITSKHILTANHCTLDRDRDKPTGLPSNPRPVSGFSVVLRDSTIGRDPNETAYSVVSICRARGFHYRDTFPMNDYAVLTLNTNIEFDHYRRPACLPYRPDYCPPPRVTNRCYVMGWGDVEVYRWLGEDGKMNTYAAPANQIMDMPVAVRPCQAPFQDSDSTMCLKKLGRPGAACHGDSGSPVLCKNPRSDRWTAIGLISHGSTTCKQGDQTEWLFVATKLTTLLDTIKEDCKI